MITIGSEEQRGTGREERFRRFYDDTLPGVYGYLLHRCGNSELALDLTQEVYLAAAEGLRRGDTVDDAHAWVTGIARHKLIDHVRRQARRRRIVEIVRLEQPDRIRRWGIDDATRWADPAEARLAAALARVPPAQRAALILRHIDDLTIADVAGHLERSVRATESLLVRGRRALAAAYEDEETSGER